MVCPVCHKNLKTVVYENQEIYHCSKCNGVWFDKGKLLAIVNNLLSKQKVDAQTVKEAYRSKVIGIDKMKPIQRKCPRCSIDMQIYNYSYDSNIFLDKCPQCNGIWADKGEMQAVAKYIRGNPDMNSYAKSLVNECNKYQRSRSNTRIIIAAIMCLFYLGDAFLLNGLRGLLEMLHALIFILGCIFFGEALGGTVGVRFDATFLTPVITKPTPGVFISFMGWVLLFFPIIFTILQAIGLLN